MAGRVDFYFAPIAPALALLREGKVVALAIGSSKRASALPHLPTTLEAGYPDSDYNFWIGAFTAGKTPPTLIARIHREITAVMRTPEVRQRIERLGAEPMNMSPAQFDTYVRHELRVNALLVKEAGIVEN